MFAEQVRLRSNTSPAVIALDAHIAAGATVHNGVTCELEALALAVLERERTLSVVGASHIITAARASATTVHVDVT